MLKLISGSDFPKVVIPLINDAKKSISAIVFDWRWYPQDPGASCQLFNQAVVAAARRGVCVRAVVNNDQIALIFKQNGCDFRKFISKKLLHCKLIIIDDQIVITGSHNYTQSAFQMNLELSLVLDDVDTVAGFNQFFTNLWQQKLS